MTDKYDQWLYDQINRELDIWFRGQCANNYADYYIYYKIGDIRIAEDAPDTTYSLACPQRLNKAATIDQQKSAVYNVIKHCACLPV